MNTGNICMSTAGDLGDLVAGCLGVLSSIEGKHTIVLRDDGRTKGIVKREAIIRPLLESQSYIKSCEVFKDQEIDWASEEFRKGFHSVNNTLLYAHGSHAKANGIVAEIPKGDKPWLKISPDSGVSDRIVINRSNRYNNPLFDWKAVVNKYGSRLIFIGLRDEHLIFESLYGKVEHRPTATLVDVAQLIAGSALFIGNQSSAMTIAEGLKHPRIQETCLTVSDCIYPGSENAQYVADGSVLLPALGDGKDLQLPSLALDPAQVSTMYIPPKGWMYQDENLGGFSTSNFNTCASKIKYKWKLLDGTIISTETAERMVLSYNCKHQSAFFAQGVSKAQFSNVHHAILAAGITEHPIISLMKGQVTFNL